MVFGDVFGPLPFRAFGEIAKHGAWPSVRRCESADPPPEDLGLRKARLLDESFQELTIIGSEIYLDGLADRLWA